MKFTPGYVCWNQPGLNETVVVDAVMPSQATFLATHRPTRILKRELDQSEGGVWCDEETLLRDFLAPDKDLLLMPIIGGSGTGKSHLIRWLHARIEESEARKVVYIPKYGTNLRSVIELILKDMTGDVFDELRRDLGRAADALNETEAPDRLVFELALRVQSAPAQPRDGERGPGARYRQLLIAELPKLLSDYVFKTRLLAPDGVISRLTLEALRGRSTDQKESPYEFAETDLPTDVIDIKRAGAAAQEIYQHLVGSPGLRAAAVTLLNEQLEPAVRNLFGMGGQRVSDVMRKVRIALLERGTELVLLVEDFALLQGIQRELLDALIEAPVRDNRRVLCPIRTAMAVTSGYFASLDTARTRVAFGGYAYSLDIPFDPNDEVGEGYALDMIAGYLNAARLGSDRLDQALDAVGSREGAVGRGWVPNKCDQCPIQEPCHDAFGTSSDGYGLYPFNRAALARMLRARMRGSFDPRDVLARVVRLTLGEQEPDLREGRYPSAGYLRAYADPTLPTMDAELVAHIRQLDRQDSRRRIDVLTFWGDCPDGIVNLNAGVHEAFALPELDAQRRIDPVGPTPEQRRQPEPTLSDEDSRSNEDLEEIRKWATGNYQLSQSLAASLRRWIHAAVVSRIEWNEEFWRANDSWVSRGTGSVFRAASVKIENASGGGASGGAVSVEVGVSNDNERLLGGLVRFHRSGHWNFPKGDGPALFRLYCNRIDDWAQVVLGALRTTADGGSASDPIPSLVGLLAFGARVLGLRGARSNTFDGLLNAIFEEGPETVTSQRGPHWTRLVRACFERVGTSDSRKQLRERLLERVAVAQGAGQPLAINVTRLMPSIKEFKAAGLPPEPAPTAPPGTIRHWKELSTRMEPAVQEELARLQEWSGQVDSHLGAALEPEELVRELRSVLRASRELGVLGPERLGQVIDERVRDFRRARLSEIENVNTLLREAEAWPPGKLISELAVDRDQPLDEIRRFVIDTNDVLTDTEARLKQQISALERGAIGGLDALRSELESLGPLLGGSGGDDTVTADD